MTTITWRSRQEHRHRHTNRLLSVFICQMHAQGFGQPVAILENTCLRCHTKEGLKTRARSGEAELLTKCGHQELYWPLENNWPRWSPSTASNFPGVIILRRLFSETNTQLPSIIHDLRHTYEEDLNKAGGQISWEWRDTDVVQILSQQSLWNYREMVNIIQRYEEAIPDWNTLTAHWKSILVLEPSSRRPAGTDSLC